MVIGNCPVCGAEMRVGTDMTNADRIRSMSDEELAEFMAPHDSGCPRWKENPIPCTKRESCKSCWLDWLREECE